MSDFQGTVIHSHAYREPEAFTGQTVLCLGAGASGQDICMELASRAKQVILSHNRPPLQSVFPDNVSQQVGVKRLTENSAVFKNGEEQTIDTLILCTGYCYEFPFLNNKSGLTIEDERLTPLFKHIVHADFPSLFFIGICKRICPFPQFDCQVRFVLSILDGTQVLPSAVEMKEDAEKDFQSRLERGMPACHAHNLGLKQWVYNDDLAALGRFEPIPRVVQNLCSEVYRLRATDLPNCKKRQFILVDDKTYQEQLLLR